ncbi:hypothetical protein HNP02_007818 [Mycobacterium sp. AZCC_0083]|nr:hypothetical protein [Mycobacterium sp. AZCC_0083]
MFSYFPNNYTWSSAVMLCLMAGGQLGQIDRLLASLRNGDPDIDAWTAAWGNAAADREGHAKQDLRQGFTRSASARYLRASTYYLTGERQTPPGLAKSRSYAAGLFARFPPKATKSSSRAPSIRTRRCPKAGCARRSASSTP